MPTEPSGSAPDRSTTPSRRARRRGRSVEPGVRPPTRAARSRSVGRRATPRRTRATTGEASEEEEETKQREDVDTDAPPTPTQALIGEIDEVPRRSSSEEAEERSASAQVEGTLADTERGERGDAPSATDTRAHSTEEQSESSSDSDDDSRMSSPVGFLAELEKKRAAAQGKGRTDAELDEQQILYPRNQRGVGKDADKLRARLVELAPKDSIGRLKPEDIKNTADLSHQFVDAKSRKDQMKSHTTMYDVYYPTEIPVVTLDASGNPTYEEETDSSGNTVIKTRPLMDPAYTDVIPMEQVRFQQSNLKRHGSPDDATTLIWLQEYLERCVEDTLAIEVKDDMERLASKEGDRSAVGPLVFFKMVYDKMTTYHEEQINAAVSVLTKTKPSDFDGEDIDKFAQHLSTIWTYLSGVPGGRDYRPYDVIEQLMDNLATGTSCEEFSEKFVSTKSNWKNPLMSTQLDNKTVDERFHAVLTLARHEYQRLSVTKEDGTNAWTGAGRKAEGSVFNLTDILCWNCGNKGHRAPDCPEEKVKPYRYAPSDAGTGRSRGNRKSGGRGRGHQQQRPRSKYPSAGERRAPKGDETTKGRSMTNLITGTVEQHWPCATCRTSFGDGWAPHKPGKEHHQAYLQRRTQLQQAMAAVDTEAKANQATAAAAAAKKEEDDRIDKIIAAKVSSAVEQAVPEIIKGMKAHFGGSDEEVAQYGYRASFHRSSKD